MFGSLSPEWFVPHTHTSSCYKTVYNKPCNHVINAHDHTDSCKAGCNGELNSHNCLRAGCVKRVLACGYDWYSYCFSPYTLIVAVRYWLSAVPCASNLITVPLITIPLVATWLLLTKAVPEGPLRIV